VKKKKKLFDNLLFLIPLAKAVVVRGPACASRVQTRVLVCGIGQLNKRLAVSGAGHNSRTIRPKRFQRGLAKQAQASLHFSSVRVLYWHKFLQQIGR
jgi:hypothetical protein